MGVEFAKTINPYEYNPSRVVTSSRIKTKLCKSVGVGTEPDPTKIARVGRGEINHDLENGHGVLVRQRLIDIPYPVGVVQAKAKELLTDLIPNGHRHIGIDSTWQVLLEESGEVISLNKPDTRVKRDKMLSAIAQLRGRRISSDTGIAVISEDLNQIDLYHASLMVGKINPNLDMGSLEQMVLENPTASSGIKAIDAVQAGIIVPDDYMQFCMRKISPYGAPFLQGHIMRYDANIHKFANEPVNNPWIMKTALGIIPRK